MKSSLYNFLFDFDGHFSLLYNSRTNALLKISKRVLPAVQALLNDTKKGAPEAGDDSGFRRQLSKGGFLVPESLNEIDELKVSERAHRFSNNQLGLTICTTLGCNMACGYCYQKKESRAMSKAVRRGLVDFVSGYADSIRSLHVAWFGGEPLLARSVIFELSDAFEEMGQKKGFSYRAGIITNGYLLTKSVAKKLTRKRITSAQVTLDGPRDVHNVRRPLKNGGPTFDVILRNVQDTVDLFDSFSVRVNIDKTNCSQVDDLIDELDKVGLKNRVYFYFGHVDALTDACRDNSHNCFGNEDFSSTQVELSMRALKKKLAVSDYPTAGRGCCAVCLNSFVVDPLGHLYKCYNTVGVAGESVGHVKAGPDNGLAAGWLTNDLFSDPECLKCQFLPVCLGECPYVKIQQERRDCPTVRFNLESIVKLEYMNSLVYQTNSAKEGIDGRKGAEVAAAVSRDSGGV